MRLRFHGMEDDMELNAYDVGREVAIKNFDDVMGYATPAEARAFAAELLAAADIAEKNNPVPGLG